MGEFSLFVERAHGDYNGSNTKGSIIGKHKLGKIR
jgi:hypothetical protein